MGFSNYFSSTLICVSAQIILFTHSKLDLCCMLLGECLKFIKSKLQTFPWNDIRTKHPSKHFSGFNSKGCYHRPQLLGAERPCLLCLATFAQCLLEESVFSNSVSATGDMMLLVNTVPSSDGRSDLLLAFSVSWFLCLLPKLTSSFIFISHLNQLCILFCRYFGIITVSPQPAFSMVNSISWIRKKKVSLLLCDEVSQPM